jgi:hypothetical protein
MNIFLTDPDPTACAQALDNSRVVKMVLETAQLLSAACEMLQIEPVGLYRVTHMNHPCGVFARQSLGNFKWLVEHGLALSAEFEFRFRKVHASEAIIKSAYQQMMEAHYEGDGLTNGWRTDLVFSFNCSGFNTGDVFEDYRECMRRKWATDKIRLKWSHRGQPAWR